MVDPFAPFFPSPSVADSPRRAWSLFELNVRVRAVLQHAMPESVWLAAEISELRVASNGHCYLEFVEKDPASGSLVAKARGCIWRENYLPLSTRFEQATGQPLAAGMKVMAEVSVSFHEQYGYSLLVRDIDPSYTLGDLARRRKEIIRRLEEDGVMDLNKELPIPRPVRRIAIISSRTAAGYGDFCEQLRQSGYAFETKLFPATMQGDRVEETVIAALDRIAAEAGRWDVAVIIRGGGAATDLGGFDSYLLAANIAQFPLPVLTGIGHERDDTIADLVACKRLKTPTAVAAFLIENRAGEAEVLRDLTQRLTAAATLRLVAERRRLEKAASRLDAAYVRLIAARRQRFDALARRYGLAASRYTGRQRERLLRMASALGLLTHNRLHDERRRLEVCPARLRMAAERFFQKEHHLLSERQLAVKLAGPERILALGYSITFKGGKPVGRAADLKPGDVLTTRFREGEAQSVVK